MFCPECGNKNADNAVFCDNCGTRLQSSDMQALSAPAKKEPLSSKDKMLLIEMGVALLSVIIFIIVYNVQYSAKNVAEKYVEAVFDQDWSTVYDTMLVEGSGDFMSKEAFVTAQTISDQGDAVGADVMNVDKLSGGFSSKTYCVKYRTPEYTDVMELVLRKSGLSWKVDTQGYEVKNYIVTVPAGAEVKVDKIKVADSVKPTEKIEGYDTYVIPEIFGVTHYVEVSGDELEDVGQLLTCYGGSVDEQDIYSTIVSVGYNKEAVEKVMEQAETDLKDILGCAAANKRFSEVAAFENASEAGKEGLISDYDYLKDDKFGNGSTNYSLTKYQMSNCEMNGSVIDNGSEDLVKVAIKGNYSYEDRSISWDGSPYTDSGSGTCIHDLYYVNKGGEWELYSMSIDMSKVY